LEGNNRTRNMISSCPIALCFLVLMGMERAIMCDLASWIEEETGQADRLIESIGPGRIIRCVRNNTS